MQTLKPLPQPQLCLEEHESCQMEDCYTCNFTVACPRRIKKKKMKALKMSHSVKGLHEKVQSSLSAHRLQKLFKLFPQNSCSGLIP